MKRAGILMLLAIATTMGSASMSSSAEARGWRGHHRHVFVRFAPVYPVYTGYCRWYRTSFGLVKRCYY